MAKAILYKSKKLKDGTHPIVIRWYEKGKQRVFTVAACTPSQWNESKGQVKKNHPFHEQINEKIKDKLGQALIDGGIVKVKNNSASILEFIDTLKEKSVSLGQLAQTDKYKQLAADLTIWKPRIKTMGFDDLKEKDIEEFYLFLLSDKKGNSKNTAARKMSRLSTVFRNARRAKLTTNDPFLDQSFQRTQVTKRKLTKDEMMSIVEADLSAAAKGVQLARDAFVMQYFLRGLRIGDVLALRPGDIDNGRVMVRESKTGEARSIPLRPEVSEIIQRWSGSEYLLPILKFHPDKKLGKNENAMKRKKAIESATMVVNKNLAKMASIVGIEKKITTHIARHTFAKLAIDTVKNIRVSQELLGHKSLRVHQDYIRDLQDNDELDAAADDVFGSD